jgi:hypothetical protein
MAGWNALDKSPGWWPRFAKEGTVDGTVGAGAEASVHPAGVVALKVSLKAGESRELPFVFAWHTPRFYVSDGTEYGHFYEKMFGSAPEAARFALQNRLAFAALTDEWQNRLLRSTLPPWLIHRLINDAAALAMNSVYTRDSGLAGTKPGPPLFALLDQPGASSALGAMDRRLFAHALLAALFPRLDLAEMDQFAALQNPAGAIPRVEGNLDESVAGERPIQAGHPREGIVGASASFAFQVAQYYLWSGDQRFLDRFYPAAKHALEFSASRVLSLAVSSPPAESERALLRGALGGGERLAAAIDDRRFAAQCREWMYAIKPSSNPADTVLEQWMTASMAVDSARSGPPAPNYGGEGKRGGREESAEKGPVGVLRAALAALRGSADAALSGAEPSTPQPLPIPADLAEAASWNLLQALSGLLYEPATGRLVLTPQLPRGARIMRLPLFSPALWATFEARAAPNRLQLQFRIDRSLPTASSYETGAKRNGDGSSSANPGAVVIKQVILPLPPNRALQLTASLNLSPVTGKTSEDGRGHIVFTPDGPVTLSAGQRIEFLFRP